MADVIAVNGKPAKGTWTVRGTQLFRSTSLTPGSAIAGSGGAYIFDWVFDLMQPDGTPVGAIMTITGGTGAFLGARAQAGVDCRGDSWDWVANT